MLRKVVIGSGLMALVPTVNAATPVPNEQSGPVKPPLMRPSDLPIYEAPHAEYKEKIESEVMKPGYIKSALLSPISSVRQQVQSVWEQTESIKNTVQDNYHEIQDRSDWIIKYLREEDNKDVRFGAVGLGGLTGFIFGLRGGVIRRVVYAGLGTTAMGYICFPDETSEILKNNGALAKQYINIAYNFLYGVKPGDPQLEVHFPELTFPKNFSEMVDLGAAWACSLKKAVMPPPAKEEQPVDKKE